jgi:hypothetical protein
LNQFFHINIYCTTYNQKSIKIMGEILFLRQILRYDYYLFITLYFQLTINFFSYNNRFTKTYLKDTELKH